MEIKIWPAIVKINIICLLIALYFSLNSCLNSSAAGFHVLETTDQADTLRIKKGGIILYLDKKTTVQYKESLQHSDSLNIEGRVILQVDGEENSSPVILEWKQTHVLFHGGVVSIMVAGEKAEFGVISGMVEVLSQDRKIQLREGQHLVIADNDLIISRFQTQNYSSWLNGELEFKDYSPQEFFQDISWMFRIETIIEPGPYSNSCRITGDITSLNLEEVLSYSRNFMDFRSNKQGDTLFISELNCL